MKGQRQHIIETTFFPSHSARLIAPPTIPVHFSTILTEQNDGTCETIPSCRKVTVAAKANEAVLMGHSTCYARPVQINKDAPEVRCHPCTPGSAIDIPIPSIEAVIWTQPQTEVAPILLEPQTPLPVPQAPIPELGSF